MSASHLQGAIPRDAAAADRRRQLVDATLAIVARYGLHGTTLARVAETAGLSPGIVNHYFKTKDALLLATLTHTALEFEQQWRDVVAEGTAAARLRALIDRVFDPLLFDSRRVAVWTAFWGEARTRDDYMRVCGESDAAYHAQVLALTRQVAQDGGYHETDADAVGRALYSLLDTLPEDALADADSFDPRDARRTCLAFLASVFPNDFQQPAGRAARSEEGMAPGVSTRPPLAETLPGWTYDNAEFLELEKEHLFRRQWQLVGHVSEVAAAGDYMTLDVVDERIVVVRAEDGALHAFHNVCRHRASRVVAGDRGHCERALTCPYHGWTYNFDGSLRGVPAATTFGDLDLERLGLPRVELEEWMGFVFVRIKPAPGPAVATIMQPYQAELEPYRLGDLQPIGEQWEHRMSVNWKAVRDNDSEGYHVPVGHPGLQRLFGDSYYDELGAHGVSRSFCTLLDERSEGWSEGRYQGLLPAAAHLPDSHRRAWLYFGLFPSLSLGIYPDLVEYYQVFPAATGEACLRGRSFGLPDNRREMRAARWLNGRINEQVWREDNNFCFWTNAGLRSSSYTGGPLSDKEVALRDFHDRVRSMLPIARRPCAPAAGKVAELDADLRAAAQ